MLQCQIFFFTNSFVIKYILKLYALEYLTPAFVLSTCLDLYCYTMAFHFITIRQIYEPLENILLHRNLKDLCLGGTLAPDLAKLVHIKSM